MTILQITIFYYPDKTGIAVTSTEVAEWFVAKGHDVTVITGPPFYPEWKIDDSYRKIKKEIVNGVKVLRTRLYVPQKLNAITRICHELSFSFFVFFKALTLNRPDVIVVASPPLTSAIVAILLKAIWRRKLLLNVKDLVPDAAIELHMLSNKTVISAMHFIERRVYQLSDVVASLGHGILRRIEKKGVSKLKLVYLPDTADPALLNAPTKPKSENLFFIDNEIKDEFIVLHSGNIGVKQGVDVIIEAAKLLQEHAIAFYMVGDGSVKSEIWNLAKGYALKNVAFLPLQPRKALADMYHLADISLLTQKKEVVDIVVPSKLISMMAAGSCVIASANLESEASKIVHESDCGSVVEPENPQKLAEEILFFYHHRDDIRQKREAGKKYIREHYDRERIMNDYLFQLTKLKVN